MKKACYWMDKVGFPAKGGPILSLAVTPNFITQRKPSGNLVALDKKLPPHSGVGKWRQGRVVSMLMRN